MDQTKQLTIVLFIHASFPSSDVAMDVVYQHLRDVIELISAVMAVTSKIVSIRLVRVISFSVEISNAYHKKLDATELLTAKMAIRPTK